MIGEPWTQNNRRAGNVGDEARERRVKRDSGPDEIY